MLSLLRDSQVALEDARGPRPSMWPNVKADASHEACSFLLRHPHRCQPEQRARNEGGP
jgi:hypothetical protein